MSSPVNRQSVSVTAEVSPPKVDRRIRLNSVNLFAGERELIIEHAGDEYRLRLTNQGKLILTK